MIPSPKPARGVGRRPLLAGLLLLAVTLFYGCDALVETGDTLVLQPKDVTFRFEFSSESITTGETVSLQSMQAVDLTSALRADGYTKSEVVSAQVSSVTLRRVNPLTFQLAAIRDVAVGLVASGMNDNTIASQQTLPAAGTASLTLGSGRTATSFVKQPAFAAVLQFVPTNLAAAEDYVLEVTVELRIEVEGP